MPRPLAVPHRTPLQTSLRALFTLVALGVFAASAGCLVGLHGPVPTAFSPSDEGPAPAAASRYDTDDGDDGDEDDATPSLAQPAPRSALPPPAAPTPEQVERELAPYGKWIDTPEYGRVWVPGSQDANWQPYTDGSWAYTNYGWSFAPTVSWGWLAFHYGRWGYGSWGWFWEPGYLWGPAWVSWRIGPGYHCWSALGPRNYHYGRGWRGWVTAPAHTIGRPIGPHRITGAHAATIVRSSRPVARAGSNPGTRGGYRYGGTRDGGTRYGGTRYGGGARGGGASGHSGSRPSGGASRGSSGGTSRSSGGGSHGGGGGGAHTSGGHGGHR